MIVQNKRTKRAAIRHVIAVAWLAILMALSNGHSQAQEPVVVDFDSVGLQPELREVVESSLIARPHGLLEGNRLAITSVNDKGDWMLISVAVIDGPDANPEAVGGGNSGSLMIAQRDDEGVWQTALAGTKEFSALLRDAPSYLVASANKPFLDPLAALPQSTDAITYKFPWPAGDWSYWNGFGHSQIAPSAIDIGTTGSERRILASAGGVIDLICRGNLSANVRIRHDDGVSLYYAHMLLTPLGTGIAEGQRVEIGRILGQLKPGTWSDNCGYTSQQPGSAHIHWILPSSGALTVDGWTIAYSDSRWKRGTEQRGPGSTLTSTNVPHDGPNACCGCSASLASIDAPPLGGQPIGPPAPQPEVAAAPFDLTAPGDATPSQPALERIVAPLPDANPPALALAVEDGPWTAEAAPPPFRWPAASDDESGVAGYHVYWGPDANGTGDTLLTEAAYAPPTPPDTSGGAAVYYLRLASLDNAGNLGEWRTVNVWRYDALAPSGTVQVAGGEIVPALPVMLHLSAADTHSGVTDMRFSSDGITWGEWEPFAPQRGWQLADVDGPQSVFVQFRDAAGNVSAPAQTVVAREFITALPSSANYRITRSVMGMGGGAKSSTGYRLLGTSGQPYQTGAMQSGGYRLASGYWAQTSAPVNNPPDAPANPSPANGATGVALTAALGWSGSDPENDPLTYEVRFGTSNPPPTVVSSQSATTYDPPGDLAPNTTYYWRVTAKDAFGGSTLGPVWSFTTAGGGSVFLDVFYLSPSANVTLGGIPAQGADVLRYTKSTNSWAMLFDGSDHGLSKNVSAFALTDDGSLLLVFAANQTIAGLGTATPYDVVKFTPTTPGNFPLGAGTFSIFFQGRLKSLTTTAEKIDAIDLVGNRLLLSTGGAASVPKPGGALKATDEDVFVFNLGTNAYESALLIDGSKIAGMATEDITGIWDDPQSGDYYITILGAFTLGGVKGNDKNIVKLSPNGGTSVYTPSLVTWLATGATLPSTFKIDGIELVR